MRGNNITDSEIIADIRRVARLLQHSPSSLEYMRHGRFDVTTLRRRFQASWQGIIEAAGLRYTPRTFRRIPATEEICSDLRRVMKEVNHPPTRAEYEARGNFGAETVRRRSGHKLWEDAIASLINVCREEVKSQQRKGGCYRTTEEWLARLHELSQKLGHAPTTREANEGGINAHQLCMRVGCNWVEVLKAAGIDIRRRTRHATLLSTKTEVLMEDVLRISRKLGRPASRLEYKKLGCYSDTTVRNRLGGWRQVKKIVNERFAQERIERRTHSNWINSISSGAEQHSVTSLM